jgi:hypothetical protein
VDTLRKNIKVAAVLTLASFLLVSTTLAGLRGRGEYNGVVIFDRWDACYLYSGIYLMPVSEKIKESLRAFQGRPMLIDVQEVYQPINPGDGLITKLTVLGPAKEPEVGPFANSAVLKALSLGVATRFSATKSDQLIVQLQNRGASRISIKMYALAPTLLAKKRGVESDFEPSDGPSYALVTRFDMALLSKHAGGSWLANESAGTFGLSLAPGTPPSTAVDLDPGQSLVIPILFHLAPGEYEFLAGYGGGVHAERCMATNQVRFNVDKAGKAHLF